MDTEYILYVLKYWTLLRKKLACPPVQNTCSMLTLPKFVISRVGNAKIEINALENMYIFLQIHMKMWNNTRYLFELNVRPRTCFENAFQYTQVCLAYHGHIMDDHSAKASFLLGSIIINFGQWCTTGLFSRPRKITTARISPAQKTPGPKMFCQKNFFGPCFLFVGSGKCFTWKVYQKGAPPWAPYYRN